MKKLHCYQALLLLGSLLMVPLHAVHTHKKQKEQPYVSEKSVYTHGDLSFISEESYKIDRKELKKGLIDLSQRIKALQ